MKRLSLSNYLAVILVCLSVLSHPVSALAVKIDFENLSPGVIGNEFSLRIGSATDQYSSLGVTFNGPAIIRFTELNSVRNQFSPTPFIYFKRYGLEAGTYLDACYAVEFCQGTSVIDFTKGQTRVKVAFFQKNEGGTPFMHAFDVDGNKILAQPFSFSRPHPAPNKGEMVFESKTANIRRVSVGQPDSATQTSLSAYGLLIKSVEFDTVGPPLLPPPCLATQVPSISITSPMNGVIKQYNDFSLSGSINAGSNILDLTSATVTVTGSAGQKKSGQMIISTRTNGTSFYPLSTMSEFLSPGDNTATIEVKNCLGSGRDSVIIKYEPIVKGTRYKVMGMEVTQAIQDMNNSVPLIAEKRTFVRVYLRVEGGTSKIYNVGGTLFGCRVKLSLPYNTCGDELPGIKSLNRITVDSSTDLAAKRAGSSNGTNPNDPSLTSLNFELSPAWRTAGIIAIREVRVQINTYPPDVPCDGCRPRSRRIPDDGVEMSDRLYFEAAPPVRLQTFSVPYTITVGNMSTPFNPNLQADHNLLVSWLQRAYPTANVNVNGTIRTLSSFKNAPNTATSTSPNNGFICNDVNSKLSAIQTMDRFDSRTRYYGLVGDDSTGSGGLVMRGCAPQPGTVGSGPTGNPALKQWGWDVDASYGDWYGGHELGHNYGRGHVLGTDSCGGAANDNFIDKNYPSTFTGGLIGNPVSMDFFGFDVGDAGLRLPQRVYPPNVWADVMSYRCNIWISNYTYQGILGSLRAGVSGSGGGGAAAGPAGSTMGSGHVLSDGLFVQGEVNLTRSTVVLLPFLRLPDLESTPRPGISLFTIELLDNTRKALGVYPFTPKELADTPEGEDQTALLGEVVPYIAGTAFIVITKNNTILAERPVSPNTPQVHVTSPNGGETLSGKTVTVSWTASDADGDAITYSLLYSNDGGITWRTMGTGITDLEYKVNLQELPGGNKALFRVIGTDGVNTGSDESNAFFHVPQKTPEARIISPGDGSIFTNGQTIVFEGNATDLEEGNLDGDAIQWVSDEQGVLGTGRSLGITNLIAGTHVITLMATDQSGSVGVATIQIEIVGILPVFYPFGEADLEVTKTGLPDPVSIGSSLTYTITVTNHGPSDVTRVVVLDLLSPGASFISAHASQGSCERTDTFDVSCHLGTLNKEDTATVTIIVTPTISGLLKNTANVDSDDVFDLDRSNDSVTIQTTVLPNQRLSITRIGEGRGTITSDPLGIACGSDCSASYPFGKVVTLTATPAPGSVFAGWAGGCLVSRALTTTVNMTAAKTCRATFRLTNPPPAILTVRKEGLGKGTVTSTPAGILCGAVCTKTYKGGEVILSAAPATGSVFAGWSGACSGSTLITKVTMTAAKTCTARFNIR